MGLPLFQNYGIDIAKLINQHISPAVLPATLTKVTPGTRTAGQLTGGTNPTTTSYACRGFIDSKNRHDRDGELIDNGTETILLIGDSISGGTVAPTVGDRVTIEGTLYVIQTVGRDPAGATYSLQCTAA